jgi:hypothetical protein
MKSKLSFLKDQSSSTSSSSKAQFGGVQLGWVGAMSTPVTCAEGYLSAIPMAHIPVPVPRSRIRWTESDIGAKKQLSFQQKQPLVMLEVVAVEFLFVHRHPIHVLAIVRVRPFIFYDAPSYI